MDKKNLQKILCFTDSLSAIHLILNYRVSSYRKIISEIQRRLMKIQDKGIILYIQILTSHDGILGNEVADQASKKACKLNVITACEMKFEELLINLKSKFLKFNFTQWNTNKTSLYIGQHRLGSRYIDSLMARIRSVSVGAN